MFSISKVNPRSAKGFQRRNTASALGRHQEAGEEGIDAAGPGHVSGHGNSHTCQKTTGKSLSMVAIKLLLALERNPFLKDIW